MTIRWVLDDQGREWGTAAQIAAHLGGGVRAERVRQWARYDKLPRAVMKDRSGRPEVRYPVLEAAKIDQEKRASGRGRRRLLDTGQRINHTAG